jgi:hypothetical protein
LIKAESPYFRAYRDPEALRIMAERPTVISLMWGISCRARVEAGGPYELGVGESLIGDWKSFGYETERKYRTDIKIIQSLGWVSLRPTRKGMRRGTIATITATSPFQVKFKKTIKQEGSERAEYDLSNAPDEGVEKTTDRRQKFDGSNDGSNDELNLNSENYPTNKKSTSCDNSKEPKDDGSDGSNGGSNDGSATDKATEQRRETKYGSRNGRVHPRKITLERTEIPQAEKLEERFWHSRRDGPEEMAEYKAAKEKLKQLRAEHAKFPQ